VRSFGFLLVAACSFRHGAAYVVDSTAGDAPLIDAPAADVPSLDATAAFCPVDAHLVLCFSFDQNPLTATQSNEAAAAVTAQIANVTSVASPLGRAAMLRATSDIFVPMGSGVTGVQSAEIWMRYDTEPANNGDRFGMFDSNIIPPNISLFMYRADPSHQLRCGIGGQLEVWDAPQLHTGAWFHLLCTCDGTNLHMVVDGSDLGARPGNCASGGAFVSDGFAIGSDNYGGGGGQSAQLAGAIDGIRLWNQPQTF